MIWSIFELMKWTLWKLHYILFPTNTIWQLTDNFHGLRMFQTIKTILTALVSLSGDSENDMVDMSLDDSESVEEDEVDESKEGNKS